MITKEEIEELRAAHGGNGQLFFDACRRLVPALIARVEELEETLDNTCTIHWWGDAHDGPGWYYVDDEYPGEGSVGSFLHLSECIQHAMAAGYLVTDASDSQLVERMRVVEVTESSDIQQAKAAAWYEGFRAGIDETQAARRHDGNSEFALTPNPYRKDGE